MTRFTRIAIAVLVSASSFAISETSTGIAPFTTNSYARIALPQEVQSFLQSAAQDAPIRLPDHLPGYAHLLPLSATSNEGKTACEKALMRATALARKIKTTAKQLTKPPFPSICHPTNNIRKRESATGSRSSRAWAKSGLQISHRTSGKRATKQQKTTADRNTRQRSPPRRASRSSPPSSSALKTTSTRSSASYRATSPRRTPSSRPSPRPRSSSPAAAFPGSTPASPTRIHHRPRLRQRPRSRRRSRRSIAKPVTSPSTSTTKNPLCPGVLRRQSPAIPSARRTRPAHRRTALRPKNATPTAMYAAPATSRPDSPSAERSNGCTSSEPCPSGRTPPYFPSAASPETG